MTNRISHKGNGNIIYESRIRTSVREAGGSFNIVRTDMLKAPIHVSCISTDIARTTLNAAKKRPGYWIDNTINIHDCESSVFSSEKIRSSLSENIIQDENRTVHTYADKDPLPTIKSSLNAAKATNASAFSESSTNADRSDTNIPRKNTIRLNQSSLSSSAKVHFTEGANVLAEELGSHVLRHTLWDNDIYNGYKTARVYVNGAIVPLQTAIAAASLVAYKRNMRAVKSDLKKSGIIDPSCKNVDINKLAKRENLDIHKSVGELRNLLAREGLTEKQKTILNSAIAIRTYKGRLYSFRRAKRSLDSVIKRYIRYTNRDDDTYRFLTSRFFLISRKAARSAMKAALRTIRKQTRIVANTAVPKARKAATAIYNRNDMVKETVNAISAVKKKSIGQLTSYRIKYSEGLKKAKTAGISAAKNNIKKAGSRVLGEEGLSRVASVGKSVRRSEKRVHAAERKIVNSVSGTASAVRKSFDAMRRSIGKYVLVPAVFLCIVFALTSIFGGSIISMLSVMESGFIKADGGNADKPDSSMLNTIAAETAELNRLFENKLQNTALLTADITNGVTENGLYDSISQDIALVVAAGINLSSDVKKWMNENYGTGFDTEEAVESDDIITYIDDYRISCVDADGNELASTDLNNDGTIFSMASVFAGQDIGSETPLALRNRAAYMDYALFLWYETHRYSVETVYKGACSFDGISWKEDHSFICKNGHWGVCQECGLYKDGTNDGNDEGAYHTYEAVLWDSKHENSYNYTYTLPCDGSDVYWECPGHVDITSKVIVGSLEAPTKTDDKMGLEQMEKDAWVFSMDYLGCNEFLGTTEYIASFGMNMLLTARSFALNKISSAFGWETLEEDSSEVLKHYSSNLNPAAIWKGWFDPETRQGNWEWVRLYYLVGESTDADGKKGWETLYGYCGTPYLIYSGANGGENTVSGAGNASRAEVKAALAEYDLTDFQKKLMDYAMMAADKPVWYYWGGSPSAKDIGTVDYFGNIVAPDSKGRKRRGLDCSGFICWCYQSAGNTSFKRLTTSDMISGFSTCDAESLVPGDIIVYNNASSGHTKLFCGYKDGYYYFIESVGEPRNRVIYSKCSSFSYLAKDLSSYR